MRWVCLGRPRRRTEGVYQAGFFDHPAAVISLQVFIALLSAVTLYFGYREIFPKDKDKDKK